MRVLLAAAFVLSMAVTASEKDAPALSIAEIPEYGRCLIGPEGGLVQTGVAPDPEA
jgi:hypothetical protein